jgi:hypothetical protein
MLSKIGAADGGLRFGQRPHDHHLDRRLTSRAYNVYESDIIRGAGD